MNAHPRAEAQPLELLVLQHRGQVVDFAWQWPADALQAQLADILETLDGGAPDFLTPLRGCTLHREQEFAQTHWVLGNASADGVCSVNGSLLEAGSRLHLLHGDEIELGLTRMVVSLEPSEGLADMPTRREQSARFDLRALGEAPVVDAPPQSTPADPAPASTDPLTQLAADPLSDPLAALHHSYLETLRNPLHADTQDLWQDLVRARSATQAVDPMQHWMQAAGHSASLDDVLLPAQTMDAVIQGLNPLGGIDLLAAEPFESIMHLFAPEALRPPAGSAHASAAPPGLPELTQREHHSLSLDSAMPFMGAAAPSATDL